MTLAGNNIKVRIWRINYADDDSVGGAVITGSYVGDYPARLQPNPEEQIILQQGLETERTFKLNIVPGYLDIRERDELEVIAPTDHIYYNKWFRIRGVSYSSLNKRDPRNYMMLTLSRSIRAHSDLSLTVTPSAGDLYTRFLALSPTIYNPMGDLSGALLDVTGNGAHINLSGTSATNYTYGQTGCGDGRLSVAFSNGCVGTANAAYSALLTPTTQMSTIIWAKFIPPFLAAGGKVFSEPVTHPSSSYILMYSDSANAIKINCLAQSNSQIVTKTGVDYGWHCWAWTFDAILNRFRVYYEGTLVEEKTQTFDFLISGSKLAFIGGTAANPSLGSYNGYLQHHAYFANIELTQTQIASVSIV